MATVLATELELEPAQASESAMEPGPESAMALALSRRERRPASALECER